MTGAGADRNGHEPLTQAPRGRRRAVIVAATPRLSESDLPSAAD